MMNAVRHVRNKVRRINHCEIGPHLPPREELGQAVLQLRHRDQPLAAPHHHGHGSLLGERHRHRQGGVLDLGGGGGGV